MAFHQDEVSIFLLALTATIAISVGIFIIPFLVKLDKHKRLCATPNSRSSHAQSISSVGGIGIFIALALALLPGTFGFLSKEWGYIFSATALLFLTGVKDDIFDSSPYFKLAAQGGAALLLTAGAGLEITNLHGLFGIYSLPPSVGLAVSALFVITVINAVNFIDGIDGLAALTGIVGCAAFGLIFYELQEPAYCLLAVAMAAALVSFLRFNFSKHEKVFMGDTGSLIVGLLFAVFILKFVNTKDIAASGLEERSPFWIISLVALPVFDFFRVFLLRIYNGKSPLRADRNHVHHIMVDHYFDTHKKASLFLTACSVFLSLTLFSVAQQLEPNLLLLIFLTFFAFYTVGLHYVQKPALAKGAAKVRFAKENEYAAKLSKHFALEYKKAMKKERQGSIA